MVLSPKSQTIGIFHLRKLLPGLGLGAFLFVAALSAQQKYYCAFMCQFSPTCHTKKMFLLFLFPVSNRENITTNICNSPSCPSRARARVFSLPLFRTFYAGDFCILGLPCFPLCSSTEKPRHLPTKRIKSPCRCFAVFSDTYIYRAASSTRRTDLFQYTRLIRSSICSP